MMRSSGRGIDTEEGVIDVVVNMIVLACSRVHHREAEAMPRYAGRKEWIILKARTARENKFPRAVRAFKI